MKARKIPFGAEEVSPEQWSGALAVIGTARDLVIECGASKTKANRVQIRTDRLRPLVDAIARWDRSNGRKPCV